MKYLMIIIALMISSLAIAQQNINVDDPNNRNIVNLAGINGEPVSMFKYNRIVEGSVFLPSDFADAMIIIKFNKRPLTAKAKLNIMDRNLHYLDQQGHEMLTKMPIEEIQFKDPATGNLLVFTTMIECNTANSGWYEIIEKGKVNLYREITKTITENKPYGSATTEQKVNTYYKYWIKTADRLQTDQQDQGFYSRTETNQSCV